MDMKAKLDNLLNKIYEKYSYDFRDYNLGLLERRITLLIATSGLKDIDEFLEKVVEDSHLFAKLVRQLSISVTSMFRDYNVFRFLRKQIIPILESYDFSREISEFTLLGIWYLIEYRINLRHISRVGFHSIRRTLNTLLARKLSDITVKSFLRHKQRTSSDMTYRYSATTFVGEEEDVTELSNESYTADKEVFEVHPFMEHWR